ncbi:MAG: RidA family protein [Flavobacteriales bacterium]|nr:RidA family protein [Flavobacteriales bacterium]
MKQAIHPPDSARPIAPYSPAIAAGGFLFISGQIALDAQGRLVSEDIISETRQVMENLRVLLNASGLSFDHLVKVTIFLSDMGHYAAVNEVYGSCFTDTPPAREALAVKGLPRGANVEISGIAALGGQQQR